MARSRKLRGVSEGALGAMLFPGCRTVADAEAAARSGESATAAKLWACARRLMRAIGTGDALDLYRRPREVCRWIDGPDSPPAQASKMTLYSALAALANPRRSGRGLSGRVPERARLLYLGRASSLGKAVRATQAKNRLDAGERAKILPWPDIVSAYRRGRGGLSDEQRVVAALYVGGGDSPEGAPRRLDYNAVRVFRGRPPARVPRGLNYVVVRSPSEVDLVLQEFKTSKHYGPYRARLPPPVSRVLSESIRARPRRWLVDGASGGPLTPSGFGARVAGTMRALTGRPIGASNLRKSYVTWLFSRGGLSRARLDEYARAMLHSPAEQRLYCRRDIASTAAKK